ncbi:MAG: MFS transporter [Defluviitaleaceae bacterium]|nr:MFS transporter [Defluviitaleaceae bacterium]
MNTIKKYKIKKLEKSALLLFAIYFSFLVQGLNDGALGVAWASIHIDMYVPFEMAGILTITAFTMYSFVSSQFGLISKYLEIQKIVLIGISIMIISNIGLFFTFYFHTLFVLIGLIASGQALIESSLNSYLAKNFSSRHMNFGLCFWGMGASISPIIMSSIIQSFNWRYGYLAILFIQFLVFLFVLYSIKNKVWINTKIEKTSKNDKKFTETQNFKDEEINKSIKKKNLNENKKFFVYQLLQMSIFFVAIGTQTTIGFWVHGVMIESRNLSILEAGIFPSLYYGFIMIGRLIFGYISTKLSNMTMIRIGIFFAISGCIILIFTTNLIGIVLIGFGISPIFPCLLHETTNRFNKNIIEKQMGYQLSAAGFGEIISSSMGFFLAMVSMEAFFPTILFLIIVLLCMNEQMNVFVIRRK